MILPSSTIVQDLVPGYAFQSEPEWRYFRFFCDHMVDTLTGPTRTTLWERSIPQAGEMQPWVRDITIALGALGISQTIKTEPDVVEVRQSQQSHESYAMMRYGQALTRMQEVVNIGAVDTRQILLISILVFCFEAMQGRKDTACINVAKGLRAIADLQMKAKQELDLNGEVLQPYPRRVFDEDLACAEYNLDTQLLHFYDPRSAIEHRAILSDMEPIMAMMPPQFPTIDSAVCFWSVQFRRNSHFVAAARAEIADLDSGMGAAPTGWSDGVKFWLHVSPEKVPDIVPALLVQYTEFLQDLKTFRQASSMVLEQHSSRPSADADKKAFHDHYASHIIHIQMAVSELQFASCFFPSPIIRDDYLPVFQDVVERAPLLIPYLIQTYNPTRTNKETTFTFHFLVSVLIALATVAGQCRIQPTRDQALSLLAKIYTEANDYKEGICEIKIIYWLAKAMRDWEEAERDPETGHIPESGRLTFAKDMEVGSKSVVCTLWKRWGEGRRLVVHEYEHHIWDQWLETFPRYCLE